MKRLIKAILVGSLMIFVQKIEFNPSKSLVLESYIYQSGEVHHLAIELHNHTDYPMVFKENQIYQYKVRGLENGEKYSGKSDEQALLLAGKSKVAYHITLGKSNDMQYHISLSSVTSGGIRARLDQDMVVM